MHELIKGKLEQYHLFKDKLREKTVMAQRGCPTAMLYRVFENLDDLHLQFLPHSFIIKLSFQSRGRGIVAVKNGIDLRTNKPANLQEIKKFLSPHLIPEINHQKIFIEELLEPENPSDNLLDIKIFFMKGEPLFLQIVNPGERPENRIYPRYHYSIDWRRLAIHKQEAPLTHQIPKPKCMPAILHWATCIAKTFFSHTFIRIDFYATSRGAVFGETTLCPNFDCTKQMDNILGSKLKNIYF